MSGKWVIQRTGRGANGLRLVYQNLQTGIEFECGKLSAGIPDFWVTAWIVEHTNFLEQNDVIQLSNGSTLNLLDKGNA